MADDEQFSLCWNNFNTNLSAGFHDSLCRGDLVDVTLAAEGQFIQAHRLVLSVCSPYFRKMFTQMPTNQHAFVFLKDVSHSALKDLIQFMYCGEVNVKQDALPAFISTAEALQIKGLTDGDPAPSQSPAKPSTPAPQQIATQQPQQTLATSIPRTKTTNRRPQSQGQQYKLDADDSDVEKTTQIVIQTSTAPVAVATSTPQTIQVQVHQPQQKPQVQQQVQQTQAHQTQTVQIQQQTVVAGQKRVAGKTITPHTVKRTKLIQQQQQTNDPLESAEQTQITVQTVTDSKNTNEAEFIDLPIELPTKSEPEYPEETGDVETVEQEATYVEDDSYGDMKYDESYFTENDETGANASATGTGVQATTSAVKQQQASFSESYVSDAGDQSATEAQVQIRRKRKTLKQPKISIKDKILEALKGPSFPVVYISATVGAMKLAFDGHHYKYVYKRNNYSIYQCCYSDPNNYVQCKAQALVRNEQAYALGPDHSHSDLAFDKSTTASTLVMKPIIKPPPHIVVTSPSSSIKSEKSSTPSPKIRNVSTRNVVVPTALTKAVPMRNVDDENSYETNLIVGESPKTFVPVEAKIEDDDDDDSMSPEDFRKKIKARLSRVLVKK